MSRQFDLAPLDLRKAWLIPGLALLVSTAVLAYAALTTDARAWFGLPILALAALLVAASIHRRGVIIEQGEMRITAGLFQRRVPVSRLQPAQARIVNLAEQSELRPLLKLAGSSVPGFQAGHFVLRDRSRAFLLLTERSRVLLLPVKDDKPLLLSLRHPQLLLDAIHPRR